jgi:hypothetical protein
MMIRFTEFGIGRTLNVMILCKLFIFMGPYPNIFVFASSDYLLAMVFSHGIVLLPLISILFVSLCIIFN